MVEINTEGKISTTGQREHDAKIVLMDDKNLAQYDSAKILELYSQKEYLEEKAEENDASLLITFLKYSTLIYWIVFICTFVAIHASSFQAIFGWKYQNSMLWGMLRDIGIGVGAYLCWYLCVKLFFTRQSSRSQENI